MTRNNTDGVRLVFCLFSASALVAFAAGCTEQPKNRCKVAPGLAVAKYTMKGTPSGGSCASVTMPLSELVGVQAFVPDPTTAGAINTPTSLAIKPSRLGDRISEARDRAARDPALQNMSEALSNYPYGSAAAVPPPSDLQTTKRPYAFGKFESLYPDDNGICTASTMNISDLEYPAIPAHKVVSDDPEMAVTVPEQPATAVKYVWSNVRVIQIPQSPGTQTFADLTIVQDGCSASYTAALLVPRVACGATDAAGKTVANQTACDPNPNEANLFGSGISQGVPTRCEDISRDPANPAQPDPANPWFLCVPTKTAP